MRMTSGNEKRLAYQPRLVIQEVRTRGIKQADTAVPPSYWSENKDVLHCHAFKKLFIRNIG